MINETKILQHMKSDFKRSAQAKDNNDALRKKYLSAYNGDLYGNETNNSSKAVSKDIQAMLKWQIPGLMGPFVADDKIASLRPGSSDDEDLIRKYGIIINTQFCREFGRFNFIKKMVETFAKEGTVVVKESWDFERIKVDVDISETDYDAAGNVLEVRSHIVKRDKIIKNRPNAIVCDNNDIYLDPTNNGSHANSKFTIHKMYTNLSNLFANKARYKNLDKVMKAVKDAGDSAITMGEDPSLSDVTNDGIEFAREFSFDDVARKEIVIYEYWGLYDIHNTGVAVPIVGAWFNDILIRLEENPMPGKCNPFHVAKMDEISNSPYGAPDFASVIDDQQNRTALLRGMIDSISNSNFGQKGITSGILDLPNKRRFFAGMNFEHKGKKDDIFVDQYNPLSTTTFSFFQSLSDTMEAKTGIKSFSGGMNTNSFNGSAAAANGTLSAAEMRKVYHIRNLAENIIKPMLGHWIQMDEAFLSPEDVFRYTSEDFERVEDPGRIASLDMDIQVSTPELDEMKAKELSFMMQTLGQNMSFEREKLILSKIAELRGMHELAKELREEKAPEPTEMDIKMQEIAIEKLQLENEKIKAEIAYRRSAAYENGADYELKIAKTMDLTQSANSRKINTDMIKTGLQYQQERTTAEHESMLRQREQKDTTAGTRLM